MAGRQSWHPCAPTLAAPHGLPDPLLWQLGLQQLWGSGKPGNVPRVITTRLMIVCPRLFCMVKLVGFAMLYSKHNILKACVGCSQNIGTVQERDEALGMYLSSSLRALIPILVIMCSCDFISLPANHADSCTHVCNTLRECPSEASYMNKQACPE